MQGQYISSSELRTCPRCEESKTAECFRLHKNGRLNRVCLDCQHTQAKQYRDSHQEQEAARHRSVYLENKEPYLDAARRWNRLNGTRRRTANLAQSKVRLALRRGEIIKPETCEECGNTTLTIEAAHADYTKPLSIRWLCRSCHRRWDRSDPKTIGA